MNDIDRKILDDAKYYAEKCVERVRRWQQENGKESRRICAECHYWEPGDYWSTNNGKHGTFIESKGWCTFKKNKRKRWNYCDACNEYVKKLVHKDD